MHVPQWEVGACTLASQGSVCGTEQGQLQGLGGFTTVMANVSQPYANQRAARPLRGQRRGPSVWVSSTHLVSNYSKSKPKVPLCGWPPLVRPFGEGS